MGISIFDKFPSDGDADAALFRDHTQRTTVFSSSSIVKSKIQPLQTQDQLLQLLAASPNRFQPHPLSFYCTYL